VIEQDGEEVAVLEPRFGVATWSTLADEFRDVPMADATFAADLEGIQQHQPAATSNEWLS